MNSDKHTAIVLSREMMSKPDGFVILDTETTGLYNCEIVQIAIIDLAGNTLLDTLVKPTCAISEGASAIHGITAANLVDAPTFKEIHPLIESIVSEKIVIIYNADFDDEVIYHCCKINNLNYLEYESSCAMETYSEFIGEVHSYFNNYKWQKLPGGDHTALGDCKATLEVIKLMAKTPLEWLGLSSTEDEYTTPF